MNDIRRILSLCALAAAVGAAAGCTSVWETRAQALPGENAPPPTLSEPIPPVKSGPGKTAPPPIFGPQPASDKVAAARFETLLNAAVAKVAAANDMSCRLVRREFVNGVLQPTEELDFAQRFEPHALRLKWVGEQHKGRELIYAAGANDGKVLVKEPGAASWLTGGKPLRLDLNSPLVKGQSRYAPDVAGYNNLVKRLAKLYRNARPIGLAWVEQGMPVTVDGRRVQTFTVALEPVLLGGDVGRMVITFDLGTSLPVRSILYDASARMVEDYDWQNLQLGPGLTDADFTF